MIDPLLALTALGGVTLAGALLVSLLDRKQELRLLETLSLGYGIGLGLLAGELLLLHLAGIVWSRLNTTLPLVLMAVGFWLAGGRLRLAFPVERFRGLEWFFLGGIVFQCLSALVLAGLFPLMDFDAAGIWGWKGKLLFLAGRVPVEVLRESSHPIYHADYPLLVPLAESWICTLLGHFNVYAAKLVFPLFGTALLGLFYGTARRLALNRPTCLGFTFLLASLPSFTLQASNGYVDLAVAYFLAGSVSTLLILASTHGYSLLPVAALLAGFCAMTKNEGMMLSLAAGAALVYILSRKRKEHSSLQILTRFLLFSTVLAAALSPWLMVRHQIGFSNDLINEKTWNRQVKTVDLARLGPILWQYQKIVFDVRNWNLLWILFLASLLCRLRRGLTEGEICVLLPLSLALAGYTTIFLITTYDLRWHLSTATARLFLHVAPLAMLFMAHAYREFARERGEGSFPRGEP